MSFPKIVHQRILVAALALVAVGDRVPACRAFDDDAAVHNHSFAPPGGAIQEHLELDLTVDFDRERIHGRMSIRFRNPNRADKLYLDTDGLEVHSVTVGRDEAETTFHLGERVEPYGRPLVVDITAETEWVNVHYETTGGAKALGWMKPEMTAGGSAPFLFTQGQSILNRSWIPCQDHPGVRITYDARITVPAGLVAVMSARNPMKASEDGVYEFSMPQRIPAYLVALAVGDLAFRPISDRCGVYAEPSLVEKAAWEFGDTEKMIQAAEGLYGPYRWERYDVIVLPPSFPFGGMENPRLSFVTPVLVAGDRSLVSTIAHELAHSWSGNLVTNATWDDFWLNEGFTTYFESRIMEVLYGVERRELNAELGVRELEGTLQRLGADSPDTRLKVSTGGRDPDDAASWIAYEKGYLFLRLIEETVGRERFDAFLRSYFDKFAFQTMTTEQFREYLQEELIRGDKALGERLRIDEWIYGPGIPDNRPKIHSEALARVEAAVTAFDGGTPARDLDTKGWSPRELKLFLQGLSSPLSVDRMRELDETFDITATGNGEILQVWFVHVIASGYEEAYPAMEAFLTDIGRIWLVSSLYRKLAETPEGLERARAIYAKARPHYHPLTVAAVERILQAQ